MKKCPFCLGLLDPNTGECKHCELSEETLSTITCHCGKTVDIGNLSDNFEYVGCDEKNNPVFRCKECHVDVYG